MSNPTWPSTLPAPQADNSAAYAGAEEAIRTQMDAGVAKMRPRWTGTAEPFSCTVKLTQAQWATLQTFYATTLQRTLPFDWTDFRSGSTATYRFLRKPAASYIKGLVNRWLVTLQLEILP
ncbi:hypothetical protein ISP17_13670 [Dyella ginsengisoli]|uniref:Phage-related protein n=1 Tax=Dyella ginsengisoli TaxID=363848 RepID=A0ABW8JXN4_9GAMM